MPLTTHYSWPYPSSSDDPDVPADMQALASAADLSLKSYMLAGAKIGTIQTGSVVLVNMTNVSSIISAVGNFDGGFAVAVNWDSGASTTSACFFRAWNIAAAGATYSNGTSIPFSYMIRVVPTPGLVPTHS